MLLVYEFSLCVVSPLYYISHQSTLGFKPFSCCVSRLFCLGFFFPLILFCLREFCPLWVAMFLIALIAPVAFISFKFLTFNLRVAKLAVFFPAFFVFMEVTLCLVVCCLSFSFLILFFCSLFLFPPSFILSFIFPFYLFVGYFSSRTQFHHAAVVPA